MNHSNYDIADEIDLLELAKEIMSRIHLVLLAALIFATVSFSYTKLAITPLYESSVSMIVNSRQDGNTSLTNDQITSSQKLVATYSVIIKSNTVLNQVIDNLHLNMSYKQLASAITVKDVNGTQIMNISVRNANPLTAYNITREIAEIAPSTLVDTVEAGSCKVISQVTAGEKPVTPNVTKNTMMGFALGAAVAIGVIVIWFLTKERHIVTDDDVQKYLELPVLGVIPEAEVVK